MREKTRNTVDVAAVSAAWDAFIKQQAFITRESIEAEGWKDRYMLEELGVSEWARKNAVKVGTLERKTFKILQGGMKREMTFYRPKV